MRLAVVIFRQLSDHPQVLHAVILEPVDKVENPTTYLAIEANKAIGEFKKKFVEFEQAIFTTKFIEAQE